MKYDLTNKMNLLFGGVKMVEIVKIVEVIADNGLHFRLNIGDKLHNIDQNKFRLDGTALAFELSWKDYYREIQ
jgi:hypothetical protein